MAPSIRLIAAPVACRVLAIAMLACLLADHAFSAPTTAVPSIRERAVQADALWRVARGFEPAGSPAMSGIPRSDHTRPLPASRAGSLDLDSLDVNWQPNYGLPVPDHWITSLIVNDGLLIAGGAFERIGEMKAPGIAAWDGTRWSTLGDFPGDNVIELASTPGGFLALSGDYQGVVWRWDGSAWQSLEPLPNWQSYASDLATIGDSVAVSLLVYDTGAWKSRVVLHGTGGWATLGGDFDGNLNALVWSGGELYAGGEFKNVGSVACSLVARWDGSSWQPVGNGLPDEPYVSSFGSVRDLTVYAGALVAGGYFGDPADPSQVLDFARWDGASWGALGAGAPQYPNLRRLRAVGSDLYALGTFSSGSHYFGIARWDGAAWHTDEDSLQTFVLDAATYRNELHAGGELANDGSRPATPLIHRVGNRWEATAVPAAAMHGFLGDSGPLVRALSVLNGAVVAGGQFRFAGATGAWNPAHGTARWNGANWSSLGMESWPYALPYDFTMNGGQLYAVGLFAPSAFAPGAPVVRFDGADWSPLSSGMDPFANAICIGSALGDVFAGGSRDQAHFNGLARWDGSAWQDVGGGITSGQWIAAIAELDGDVIVAGLFDEMGGVPCRNIAAWNATRGWHPLGTGVNGQVYALTSRGGSLYVGGAFADAGGVWVQGLARWQRGRWYSMPGPTGAAQTLGWYRNHLVVSGPFVPSRIALLEADSTWRPLGTGLDQPAFAMIESGASLYVGGFFSSAGGKAAYGFAEWREPGWVPPPAQNLAASPNPFATSAHLRYELPAAADVRVEIFDLFGHVVDRPFAGYQNAGPQDVEWRPTSASIRPGVYFARVIVAGHDRVVRVVRVR